MTNHKKHISPELLAYLTEDEMELLVGLLEQDDAIWRPLPGPQTMAALSTADVIGYGGAAGGGKGLALDTPLVTPTGWTTMGKVREGDTLIDENGFPCNVVAVSDVSLRPCFRLTFDDGAELVADDVHRWITFDAKELAALTRRDDAWRKARRASRPSRAKPTTSPKMLSSLAKLNQAHTAKAKPLPSGTMRDTAEIFATAKTESGRSNHAIKMHEALQVTRADLPVPPYTLGAWLGDGASRNGQLTGIDPGVWERVEADGFEVRHYGWSAQAHNIIGLKPLLRSIGVLCDKHIPEAYLRASYDQRLALLQGLMDTDGHAAKDGGCEFDNTNERLAYCVLELVDSLGIKATMQCGVAKLNGREISKKWRVKFTTTMPVFGLERKAVRLPKRTRRVSQFRYLVSCEPVESVPTKCIAVDSPSRQYLAGRRMVPTHNTDLAVGLSLTEHINSVFFRENGTELTSIIDRIAELHNGDRSGYNGKDLIWRRKRLDGVRQTIAFGSFPNPDDHKKQQGKPRDLIVFEEAANMREEQVRFVMGWNRTAVHGQRCRVLMTFNPPTTVEGRWILAFYAPWLDKKHPNPAMPGEIRYFATIAGVDMEVPDSRRFVLDEDGKSRIYDFDPARYIPEDIIQPSSRTFIPARVTDNIYLMNTGYMQKLQALPEPLRSQMLYGDFQAGVKDDPWQVIPTDWVDIAMARWKKPDRLPEMSAVGADIAGGGDDDTVISRRHGEWFDELLYHEGKSCSTPEITAGFILSAVRQNAPQLIDLFGVGAKPYGVLKGFGTQVYGIDMGAETQELCQNSVLGMFNVRSLLVWRMRELLDPNNNTGVALPPDKRLAKELTTFTWEIVSRRGRQTIKVCDRDTMVKRLAGKSPDAATAVMLANIRVPKRRHETRNTSSTSNYDPYSNLDKHL